MGREYDSIFFNTTNILPVTYLDEAESKRVLSQQGDGWLEFDPAALDEAYHATRGQPYLLQKIGQTIQYHFDDIVNEGGSRDHYVSLRDMELALDKVVQLNENASFDGHWNDSDATFHRILSALARRTSESKRPLTTPEVEAYLQTAGMALPRDIIHQRLEALLDQEILVGNGAAYDFAVPLYRRWIAWRWPPEKVREEALES